MLVRRGGVRGIAACAVAILLLGSGVTGGIALATSSVPVYSAVAAPATAAAGTSGSFTITLTQLVSVGAEHDETNTPELGSASIAAPAGFSVLTATTTAGHASTAGNTVTVDDLELHNPGQVATVSIGAAIACGTAGAASWTVTGHQTDAYADPHAAVQPQDPGSQLGVTVSPCRLAFAAGRQPAAAQVNQTITSTVANPAGPPVQVQLQDGTGTSLAQAGVPIGLTIASGTGSAGAVLSGASSSTDGSGLATFGGLAISLAGQAYRLLASAGAGITPATSDPFDVDDVLTTCNGSCSGTATGTSTTGTVNIGQASGAVLGMSLDVEPLSCNDAANHFYVASSQVLTFNVTGAASRKIVTIVLAKASVTRPFLRYQVCFSSPTVGFTNLYGVAIPPGGAGLLPLCWKPDDFLHAPCVLLKGVDLHGNVFATFLAPQGDPRGRI